MSRRRCFALDLVNDAALIREYCRMHEPGSVWPAVIDHIRAQGVTEMQIWQRGDRLFMIVEAADDYPRIDPSPVSRQESDKWEAYMEPSNVHSPMPWRTRNGRRCAASSNFHSMKASSREQPHSNSPGWKNFADRHRTGLGHCSFGKSLQAGE